MTELHDKRLCCIEGCDAHAGWGFGLVVHSDEGSKEIATAGAMPSGDYYLRVPICWPHYRALYKTKQAFALFPRPSLRRHHNFREVLGVLFSDGPDGLEWHAGETAELSPVGVVARDVSEAELEARAAL